MDQDKIERVYTTYAGFYDHVFGKVFQEGRESAIRNLNVQPGETVLEVGVGTGIALPMYPSHCRIVGIDLSEGMLAKAKERAEALRLSHVQLHRMDAGAMEFADDSFDVTLSTYGAMFTPDHSGPAREMLRVTRSGGRIGMANWTPEGFIGQLFKVIGKYLPPPEGLESPALWGTEPHIVELFGTQAQDIRTVRRNFNFRYRSAAHWVQVFRDFYGPTHKAFGALAEATRPALERDITALLDEFNVAGRASDGRRAH